MVGKSYTAVNQADAFALEQAPLKAGERFAHGDAAGGGEYAMPGNGLAAWACGHGAARRASPAAQAGGACQLSVGHHAALGDTLDQGVDAAPAFGHAQKDNHPGDGFPVLPPYETQ